MSIRSKNEIKRIIFPFIIVGGILGVLMIIGIFINIKPKNTGIQIEAQTEGIQQEQIANTPVSLVNLSLKIPTGWSEVKEVTENVNDSVTDSKHFIHSASNSEIYIDRLNYSPEINYMLYQDGASEFVSQGSILTDYQSNGQNESIIYYESPSNAGTYYCGQKYIWDKDEIYAVTVNINSLYYEKLMNTMDFVFNSTSHNSLNPIYEKTYLEYASNYNAEYGKPLNWIEDNGILTDGKNTLSFLTLNKDSNFNLQEYTALNFNNDFNIPNSIITSVRWDNELNCIIADGELSQNAGKIKVYVISPEVNNNKYLIGFIWQFTDDDIETLSKNCIKQYRTFHKDEATTQ